MFSYKTGGHLGRRHQRSGTYYLVLGRIESPLDITSPACRFSQNENCTMLF